MSADIRSVRFRSTLVDAFYATGLNPLVGATIWVVLRICRSGWLMRMSL
jgi:hypothetical protein